jgi:hypothetical protein
VTAQRLDGTATAAAIKDELKTRVAALRERGITPGLGTVLVGDDPGSRWYVNGKHKDCAEVGIESIRVELPEVATQEEIEEAVRGLNADETCTGYIVQLPLPRGRDENRVLGLIDPAKDADGLHPTNLGWLVPRQARTAALHSLRHRGACCAVTTCRSPEPTWSSSDAGSPSDDRSACCSPAARRTRPSRCATPAPATSRTTPRAQRRHRRRRGRRAGHHHRADMIKEGAAVLDVGVSSGRRQDRGRRRRRRLGQGRLGLAQPRRRRPDDAGDAAVQHRVRSGAEVAGLGVTRGPALRSSTDDVVRRTPTPRGLGRATRRLRRGRRPRPDAEAQALSLHHRGRVLSDRDLGRHDHRLSPSPTSATWRTGVRCIGGAGALRAAIRLVLSDPHDAGMLAVRHKPLDAALLMAGSGIALLIALAQTIPNQPTL